MTHIEKQTLRDLHRPGWRGAWFVLGFGSLFYAVVAGIVYCYSAERYAPLVLLILLNTYLSHSLVIAFHEAAHGSLCPWRPLNEYLGRAIGLNAFISLSLYRELHHWHHAHLGTPRDEEFWPFTDPANGRGKRRLAAFGELFFGVFYTPFLYLRPLVRRGSRLHVGLGRRLMIWGEVLAPLVVWGSVTAVALHHGVFAYFFLGYLLPAYLAGNIQSWRKYVEHIGLTGDRWATLTRAIRPRDWRGRLMSESVLHEPFHDLHHRYPKIPYESLPAAAKVDPLTGDGVPVFPTYRAALGDLLHGLGDPKFGPAWRENIGHREPQMKTDQKEARLDLV